MQNDQAQVLYKIVFDGKELPGTEPDAVRANLAELFGIDLAEVQKLFNRSPDVIKWDADEATARKLLETLALAGAEAHMEKQEPRDEALQCPSCGYTAKSGDDPLVRGAGGQGECPSCGVVVARFKAGEKEAAKAPDPAQAPEKPAAPKAEQKPAPVQAPEKQAAPAPAAPAKAAEKKPAAPAPAKPPAREAAPAPSPAKKAVRVAAEEEPGQAGGRPDRSRPASLSRRLLAFVCDLSSLLCLWGLLLPVAGLAWRLLYGPARADGPLMDQMLTLFTNAPLEIALGWAALALLSFLVVFFIVPAASGRTLGQKTAGIEVMDRSDGPAGTGALFLRFIGYAVSCASIVILFLAPVILPGRASLADALSGTRQQEEPQYLSGEAMMAFLPVFGAVLAVGLGIPLAALAVGILG